MIQVYTILHYLATFHLGSSHLNLFTLDWLALTLLICPFAKTNYLYSAKFHQVLTSSVKNVSL